MQVRGSTPHVTWLRFGNAPTRFIADKLIHNKNNILQMVTGEMHGTKRT